MRMVRLGELADVVSGSTPRTEVAEYWNGDIPWVTPADLSNHEGIYFQGSPKKITRAGLESCSTRILPAGSILFSSRAPIGHCAVAAYPVCTNQGFKNLIPKKNLDPAYGYFALRFLTPAIVAKGRGATFAEVTKEIIENVEFPYREPCEQKRIAAILERADRLRRLRRYGLTMANALMPAVFNQVFGDPIVNTGQYGRKELRTVCKNITDGTHDTPERVKTGVPFVTSKNIRPFEIDLTDLEFVTPEIHREIIKRCNPEFGDVLYTNIGANVGNAVANRLRFQFSLKNVALIQPDRDKLEPRFLEALLNHCRFKEAILNVSSVGGAQKFVSLDVLRHIEIILPPLSVQKRFALIVDRHASSQNIHTESLRQAEHLFQTLLHRAFTSGL